MRKKKDLDSFVGFLEENITGEGDYMIIAVDFDGTIVEHRYPEIGQEIAFAVDTLKMLQVKGFRLILWTYRSGAELEAAVQFCRNRGLEFYAVNKNYPEEKFDPTQSRKILADIYIDDRNLGGLPEWGEIYRILCPGEDTPATSKLQGKKWGFLRNLRLY